MAEWLIPCNGRDYDYNAALRSLKTIEWHQSRPLTNVGIDDKIYIYASSPVQSIVWRCLVTDTHRQVSQIDDCQFFIPPKPAGTYFPGPFIEITAEVEFTVGYHLSYKELKAHGLKSRIQGPLRLTDSVAQYVHQIEQMQDSPDALEQDAASLSDAALAALVQRYSQQPVRRYTTTSTTYSRNPYIATAARRRANGKCELCGNNAPFLNKKGEPFLESHHVVWLSRGGADSADNVAALCPNCHRRMHELDDPRDIAALKARIKQ